MIATRAARLLDGPSAALGAEPFGAHTSRLGPLPDHDGEALIDMLDAAGLRGRGGAAYPTWRKWSATREQSHGTAVVVANGSETEPLSAKDQALMRLRPHLVLDGVLLAVRAVRAERAVVYISRAHEAAAAAMDVALRERRGADISVPVSIERAPHRYVAGEETAVVSRLNGRDAKPGLVPPRPFQRGIDGRATLVQNVETLAQAALIARHGGAGGPGAADAGGTHLVTVAGAVHTPGVYELESGSTLAQAVSAAGGATASVSALLVGGYFGRWVAAEDAWDLRAGVDVPVGSGVVCVFPHDHCGVAQAAAITGFLARESARQCGPCRYGLAALAETAHELAHGRPRPRDAERLQRWIAQIAGRGACHHPDGALAMLGSALRVFSGDVSSHLRRGRCDRSPALLLPAPDWTSERAR